jgi:hypothetical protein
VRVAPGGAVGPRVQVQVGDTGPWLQVIEPDSSPAVAPPPRDPERCCTRSMKRDVLSRSSSHRLAVVALSRYRLFPWQSDCDTGKPVSSDIGSIGLLPAQLAGVGHREGGQVPCGVHVSIEDEAAGHAHVRPLGQGQLGFRWPHPEQVLLLANQRSATSRRAPARPVL